MPTIDVVVPCYNYGRYLRECVASILTQEGCELRVLIIDDASPDGSAEIARQIAAEEPRVELILHEANRGHVATFNEGIAWAGAEYFLLISADDMLLPGALSRAISIMEQRPEVTWTYGREIELHPGDSLETARARAGWRPDAELRWRVTPGAEFIERLCFRSTNHVPTCTAVVRGSAQRAAGIYRPELPHTGDLEMWLRLSSLGSVAETDGFQGVRRFHGSNMASTYPGARDLRERHAAFESFLAGEGRAMPRAAQWRRLARRRLAHQAARWGLAFLKRGQFGTGMECLGFAFRLDPASAATAPIGYLGKLRPLMRAAAGGPRP